MVALQRSGFDDPDDATPAMEAQMNAIGLSAITNISNAQRACGLPVTGLKGAQ